MGREDDFDRVDAEELERALEVSRNWGGWSFEEAELMARALLTVWDGAGLVRLSDGSLLIGHGGR